MESSFEEVRVILFFCFAIILGQAAILSSPRDVELYTGATRVRKTLRYVFVESTSTVPRRFEGVRGLDHRDEIEGACVPLRGRLEIPMAGLGESISPVRCGERPECNPLRWLRGAGISVDSHSGNGPLGVQLAPCVDVMITLHAHWLVGLLSVACNRGTFVSIPDCDY